MSEMSDTWSDADFAVDDGPARLAREATTEGSAGREETAAEVDDLVVVSNRQPYRHQYEEEGEEVAVDQPAGGLTAGLDPVMQRLEGTWIAWGDGDADREAVDDEDCVAVPPDDPSYTLERLWLSEEEVSCYYEGYSNQALWPLCHLELGTAKFDDRHWEQYRRVNRRFADAVADRADADSVVWFQDYHFTLAPRLAREALPDETFLMQFWHIPWPSADVFRRCPQREDLLAGLLGNDLLGFHVPAYCRNFLDCVDRILDDAVVDHDGGRVRYDDHVTTVRAFPMQVDAAAISRQSRGADGSFAREFRAEHGIDAGTTLALGVDRLDYTKGIPERLDALERLWAEEPDLRGELTYVQKGAESRSGIPAYQALQREVHEGIERVNDRFGTDDWTPVVYTEEMYSRTELCALYRDADVALVSPVSDGMNLVAQEYVASQVDDDGVLVLSEFAGAHEVLSEAAVTVNPYDTAQFAERIRGAVTMHPGVRKARMAALRRRVHDGGIDGWIDDILSTAATVRGEQPGR